MQKVDEMVGMIKRQVIILISSMEHNIEDGVRDFLITILCVRPYTLMRSADNLGVDCLS